MSKHVLITGGAGFIGAHVADLLLAKGYRITCLDRLVTQVHQAQRRPPYLNPDADLIIGDIRDKATLSKALAGVDAVIHLASLVGVGQSMYQMDEYVSVNAFGTAALLSALTQEPVECLVVASSMSIYGEGLYCDEEGHVRPGTDRPLERLKAGDWEMRDENGRLLKPLPTPESKPPALASIYALSKFDQERMCLLFGRAYGIRAIALRLFNTYGPFQALANPYTGVLSNFAARVLNGQPPLIYEDGEQLRDFVSVYDVARAFELALERPQAGGRALNISSGDPMTVREAAVRTIRAIGAPGIEPEITGKYRMGDIRHCFADITSARQVLGWRPEMSLEEGLRDLTRWLAGQQTADHGLQARAELSARGLLV